MRPPARRVLLVLAVALGVLAACSSDEGSSGDGPDVTLSETQATGTTGSGDPASTTAAPVEPGTAEEYSAALLGSLTDDPDNTQLMDADQAACVAPAWVETITPERLGAAGLAPEDLATQRSMTGIIQVGLSLEEAESLVQEMAGCGVEVRERFLGALAPTEGELTPEHRTCLDENLPSELIDRMVAVGLSGAEDDPGAGDASARFLAVLQTCGLYPGGS